MFRKKVPSPQIDNAVSKAVNFEITLADMARRSERRAWLVASAAIVLSLILAAGYFYMLPLKEKVPYLIMADAYLNGVWKRPTCSSASRPRSGWMRIHRLRSGWRVSVSAGVRRRWPRLLA